MNAWAYLKDQRQKPENFQNAPLKHAEHYMYARAQVANGNKAFEAVMMLLAIAGYGTLKSSLDTTAPSWQARFPILGFLSNPPQIDLKQLLSLGDGPVTKSTPTDVDWQLKGVMAGLAAPEVFITWAE